MLPAKRSRFEARKRHSGRGMRVAGTGRRIALASFLIFFAATTIVWPDAVYSGILLPDGLILDVRF
jgi:hypothetical protein